MKKLLISLVLISFCIFNLTAEEKIEFSDGKIYIGEVKNNLPNGFGKLEFPNGNIYEGTFFEGLFSGFGKLVLPNGEYFEGNFLNGLPTGGGMFYGLDDEVEKVLLDNGIRIDEIYKDNIQPLVEEFDRMRNELINSIKENFPIEEIEKIYNDVLKIKKKIDELTKLQRFFHKFEIGDDTIVVDIGKNRGIKISILEEDVIRDEDGTVIEINKKETKISLSEDGLGVTQKEEKIEKVNNPVKEISGGNWTVGYNGIFSDSYENHNFNFGFGYRSVSSDKYFPGKDGGKIEGFDLRAYAQLGVSSVSGSSDIYISASAFASIGWSFLTFKKLNKEKLIQNGDGWTIGILGGGTAIFETPAGTITTPIIAPLLTFDSYKYNPATAKYSYTIFSLYLWPEPFSISISYTESY